MEQQDISLLDVKYISRAGDENIKEQDETTTMVKITGSTGRFVQYPENLE